MLASRPRLMIKRLPRPDFTGKRLIVLSNRPLGIRIICGCTTDRSSFSKVGMAYRLASALVAIEDDYAEDWKVNVSHTPPLYKWDIETATISKPVSKEGRPDQFAEIAWFWNYKHSRGDIRLNFYQKIYDNLKDIESHLSLAFNEGLKNHPYRLQYRTREPITHMAVSACQKLDSYISTGSAFEEKNRTIASEISEYLSKAHPNEPEWTPSVIAQSGHYNPKEEFLTVCAQDDRCVFYLERDANVAALVLHGALKDIEFRALFDEKIKALIGSGDADSVQYIEEDALASERANAYFSDEHELLLNEGSAENNHEEMIVKANKAQEEALSRFDSDPNLIPISRLIQDREEDSKPITFIINGNKTYEGLPQDEDEDEEFFEESMD